MMPCDSAGRFPAGNQTGVPGAMQSSAGVVPLNGAAPTGGARVALPTSMVGGSQSSTAVRLSGPGGAAGAQVQLTSNCGFAGVPSTVIISAEAPARLHRQNVDCCDQYFCRHLSIVCRHDSNCSSFNMDVPKSRHPQRAT